MVRVEEQGIEITVKNAEGDADTKATIIHQNTIDYEPKVSVIIPVYNTEEYLRECLDSVVNQTLKEIEIICVDDGSTDSSLEILKEYAQRDNRFTIITQENLHAGVARNAGLAVAKGEHVSFLDSDDWFELNMLQEMYENIVQANSNIACCQYRDIDVKTGDLGEIRGINQILGNEVVITIKKDNYPNSYISISNPMPWNKIISNSFIKKNNIYFQNIQSSNDIYFSMLSLAVSNKITLVYKPLINYRCNRINSLKNTRDKSPLSFYYAYRGLYNSLQKRNIFEKLSYSFYTALLSTCFWTLDHTFEKKAFVKKFIKEEIVPEFSLIENSKKYNLKQYLCDKLSNLYNPDLIVSLTSYPKRINTVHLVIKSLLYQSLHADKVILWLAPEQFPNKEKDLPQDLLDLIPQGLTIDWYHDIKSYKKLIPALKKYPNSIIVTADDDNIYQKQWLEKLYNSYVKSPNDIQVHRVTKFFYKYGFEIIAGGKDYYKEPSFLNKIVGLGGGVVSTKLF